MTDISPEEARQALANRRSGASQQTNNEGSDEQGFFNKLPRNIGAGLLEGGRGVFNIPYQLKNLTKGHLFQHAQEFAPTNFSKMLGIKEEPTLSDKLLQGLTQHIPAFLAPEMELGQAGKLLESVPKIGKFAKKAIGTAIPVGAYEATQSDEPIKSGAESAAATVPFSLLSQSAIAQNPYLRYGARALLGGTGAYLGHKGAEELGAHGAPATLASLVLGGLMASGGKPMPEVRRSMLAGVEGSPYAENLAAANRLGLSYLTPAEASKNPFAGAQQGNVGRTETGAKLLHDRGVERQQTEENSIQNLLENIYSPEKTENAIAENYQKAYPVEIKQEELAPLFKNQVIKQAQRHVENTPAYQLSLEGVRPNTVEYLDHIKRALDDMIKGAPPAEGRIIKDSQSKLMKIMDKEAPTYAKARELAELKMARKTVDDVFNRKSMIGTNFYSGFLNNKQKVDSLMHHLRHAPKAQSQLKDMQSIFSDLINAPTVRTAAALSKTSMSKERSSAQTYINKLNELLHGNKYDETAVNLITDPKWVDELHRIKELTSNEKKLKAVLNLMGKASAVGVNQQND